MIYCLLYYRGLGTVVVASPFVAAGITYALVLLLDKAANFTLTLPGIAGLIVAVGITADSFIVYFERIRDEMRDGKTMRVAVEAGWKRARNTCLAADAVSLLAAVVLYIFAAGVVRGFAFALGLATLIDLAVFFWFTHPMVSWLAHYPFFNRGHKLSGLDAEALGIDRINVTPTTPRTAGGRA
jgi:preprotein translocase subunit SecD